MIWIWIALAFPAAAALCILLVVQSFLRQYGVRMSLPCVARGIWFSMFVEKMIVETHLSRSAQIK